MVRGHSVWVTVAAVAIAASAWGCQSSESTASSAPAPAAATPPAAATAPIPDTSDPMVVQFTPPPPAYNGELPPLPVSAFAPARPPDVVRAVYTFAARHPEVLHYVPCFCGCQRSGHKGNDDCFVRSRDANGRPNWEEHGMT